MTTATGVEALAERLGPERVKQLVAVGFWPPTIGVFLQTIEPDPGVIASLGEQLAQSFETSYHNRPDLAADIRRIFS